MNSLVRPSHSLAFTFLEHWSLYMYFSSLPLDVYCTLYSPSLIFLYIMYTTSHLTRTFIPPSSSFSGIISTSLSPFFLPLAIAFPSEEYTFLPCLSLHRVTFILFPQRLFYINLDIFRPLTSTFYI